MKHIVSGKHIFDCSYKIDKNKKYKYKNLIKPNLTL